MFENVVQWSAILLSALSGTYAARKFGMDYFGALVIAFVVSVGGGTIRDLLLGRFPIFWLDDPVYLVTVMIVSILGMFVQRGARKGERFAEHVAKPIEKIASEGSPLYLVIDSLALGLWAYLGTFYALVGDVPPILARKRYTHSISSKPAWSNSTISYLIPYYRRLQGCRNG